MPIAPQGRRALDFVPREKVGFSRISILIPRGHILRDDKTEQFGEKMVKLVVRDRETIQEAVRRFRKLVERSGIKKEMRRREFYEKPSETNRRARLRAERRARRTRLLSR